VLDSQEKQKEETPPKALEKNIRDNSRCKVKTEIFNSPFWTLES